MQDGKVEIGPRDITTNLPYVPGVGLAFDHHASEALRLADTPDNHYRGTVADLLYMGDVTVYRVATPGGMRVEALLANSQSGRAKFFEAGDAVEMSWSVDAGHFIEE